MSNSPTSNGLSDLGGLRHRIRQDELDFTVVKPFGPSILETTLPAEVHSAMLAMSDSILADRQRRSWGRYLVGQIREEPYVSEEVLEEYGVLDYLERQFAEFVIGCVYCNADPAYKQQVDALRRSGEYSNPTRVSLESAWIVSQRSGEYNPIHNHSMATMASVMYLKVPEQMHGSQIPGKENTDGCIEFVDRSAGDPTKTLQTSTVRVRPQAGRFYIFPSSLLHLVYPFRAEGERRSMAINATHTV